MRTAEEIKQALISREQHLSYSSLKAFLKSPSNLVKYFNRQIEPTDAMLYGVAFHHYLLQKETFDEKFAVAPKVDLRKTADKEKWNNFIAANENKTIIKQEQMDKIEAQSRGINYNGNGKWFLSQFEKREQEFEMEFEGYKFRGVKDLINDKMIGDVKTSADASPQKFNKDFWNMGYWLQAIIYAISEGYPDKKIDVLYLAVDGDCEVGLYQISDTDLLWAYERFKKILSDLNYCLAKNYLHKSYDFYAMRNGIHQLDRPSWI